MNRTIESLFTGLNAHKVSAGQILITRDEAPRGVYFVRAGYVKAYDIAPSGAGQIINIFGPGDFFPVYWSLGEGEVKLFYETMCLSQLCLLPKIDFIKTINSKSAAGSGILSYVLKHYRFTQERIQNLEYVSVLQRVAYRLLFLARYFGHRRAGQIVIKVPIIYQELAEAINSTRDTVNRVMRELIADEIVSREGGKVTICKPDRLSELLET